MKPPEQWMKDFEPLGGWLRLRQNTLATIIAIQRDALQSAAALCDKHEDECTHEPTCHAHDAVEILGLLEDKEELT